MDMFLNVCANNVGDDDFVFRGKREIYYSLKVSTSKKRCEIKLQLSSGQNAVKESLLPYSLKKWLTLF